MNTNQDRGAAFGAHLDTTTNIRGSPKRNAAFTLQHGAMLTPRQPEGCVPVVVSRCAPTFVGLSAESRYDGNFLTTDRHGWTRIHWPVSVLIRASICSNRRRPRRLCGARLCEPQHVDSDRCAGFVKTPGGRQSSCGSQTRAPLVAASPRWVHPWLIHLGCGLAALCPFVVFTPIA